jgi:hypothetical protein
MKTTECSESMNCRHMGKASTVLGEDLHGTVGWGHGKACHLSRVIWERNLVWESESKSIKVGLVWLIIEGRKGTNGRD